MQGKFFLKRTISTRVSVALLYLWLSLASPSIVGQEVIALNAISGYPPTALWVQTFLTHFIPEADRQLASTGNYEIDWTTPFGNVARSGHAFEAVQYGLGDIGIITTSFHSDKIPFYNLSYVTPFVSTNMDLVVRTISSLHERYPELKKLWEDYRQIYLVTAGVVDTYQALMNKPIRELADFNGLKMSGIGMNLRYFEGLNAVAVSSGLADFYTNISTGLTDGAIVWPEAIISYKLYEVGPYLVDARLGAVSSVALTANQRTWEELPGEVRDALLVAAEFYRDELALETVRRSTAAIEEFVKQGGTIISLTQEQRRNWAATVPDLTTTWVADMESRSLPGKQLLRDYMDVMRSHGQPIMRHWDQE